MPDIPVELAGLTIHVASELERHHAESVSVRLAQMTVARHELARQHHPDVCGSNERTAEINAAADESGRELHHP